MEPPPLPRLMLPHRLALPLAPRGEVTREALWEIRVSDTTWVRTQSWSLFRVLPSRVRPCARHCPLRPAPSQPTFSAYLRRSENRGSGWGVMQANRPLSLIEGGSSDQGPGTPSFCAYVPPQPSGTWPFHLTFSDCSAKCTHVPRDRK